MVLRLSFCSPSSLKTREVRPPEEGFSPGGHVGPAAIDSLSDYAIGLGRGSGVFRGGISDGSSHSQHKGYSSVHFIFSFVNDLI